MSKYTIKQKMIIAGIIGAVVVCIIVVSVVLGGK